MTFLPPGPALPAIELATLSETITTRTYLAEVEIVAASRAGVSSNCWKSLPTQPTAGSRS